MPYITKADLTTHLYAEILDEISRNDDTIIEKAIKRGINKSISYLSRFDINAMFGDGTSNPTFQDDYLDGLVKDIICWFIIKLANPNINIELFRTAYEDAEKDFEKINKGILAPAWPLVADDAATTFDEQGNIGWSSNTKRNNHY